VASESDAQFAWRQSCRSNRKLLRSGRIIPWATLSGYGELQKMHEGAANVREWRDENEGFGFRSGFKGQQAAILRFATNFQEKRNLLLAFRSLHVSENLPFGLFVSPSGEMHSRIGFSKAQESCPVEDGRCPPELL